MLPPPSPLDMIRPAPKPARSTLFTAFMIGALAVAGVGMAITLTEPDDPPPVESSFEGWFFDNADQIIDAQAGLAKVSARMDAGNMAGTASAAADMSDDYLHLWEQATAAADGTEFAAATVDWFRTCGTAWGEFSTAVRLDDQVSLDDATESLHDCYDAAVVVKGFG